LFARTAEVIAQKHKAISIDFPGFGNSPEPPDAWDVSAYAEITRDFIASFGYDSVILLGHSFGGRVILKMMNLNKLENSPPLEGCPAGRGGLLGYTTGLPFSVEKIILTGCAGIRHAPDKKSQRRTKVFKACKKLLSIPPLPKLFPRALPTLQKKFGSADYAAASHIMRQVLVKTVNEDLRNCMPALTMPTLLLWGENDYVTTLADGREMERLIPGAGLAVIPNAGHFAFIDQPAHFNAVVKSFLGID